MAVRLETTYEVGQGEVTLSIVIGNAQLGSSRVSLGNKLLATGDIDKLSIGMGPKIAGKSLSVKSVVTDVSDKTNQTNIRYKLKGGKTDKDFDLEATVDEEGGSIIYRATFEMIA